MVKRIGNTVLGKRELKSPRVVENANKLWRHPRLRHRPKQSRRFVEPTLRLAPAPRSSLLAVLLKLRWQSKTLRACRKLAAPLPPCLDDKHHR